MKGSNMLVEFQKSKQSLLQLANNDPKKVLAILQEEKELRRFVKELHKNHKFPQVTVNRTRITGLKKSDVKDIKIKDEPVFIYDKRLRPTLISKNDLPSIHGTIIPFDFPTEITPIFALKILLNHNVRNRKISWTKVGTYSNCRIDNEWYPTHQGLAFYEDGMFADGQHRLLSIILSGKSSVMKVSFGLDKKCCLYIDEGRTRSLTDQVKIMGEDKEITDRSIKTARWMLEGTTTLGRRHATRFYRKEVVDFYHKHKKAIEFACDIDDELKKTKSIFLKVLDKANLRAVLARMYYHTKSYDSLNNGDGMQRLQDLKTVLLTGVPISGSRQADGGALKIAGMRTTTQGKKEFGGNQMKKGYFKAEKGFDAFMRRFNIGNITRSKNELFLLPEELMAAASKKRKNTTDMEATIKI